MKGKRDQSPRDPWFGQKHGFAEIQTDALHATLWNENPTNKYGCRVDRGTLLALNVVHRWMLIRLLLIGHYQK